MVRSRKNKKNRSRKAAPNLEEAPDRRGDIAAHPKRTYQTSSCRIPRTTQVCTFRQFTEGTLTSNTTSATTQQFAFTLSTLDQASNLIGVWDQYRIDAIRFSVLPLCNANPTATIGYTPLYCVIDYDDNVALGSAAAARQYDNCIELGLGESCERLFAPKVQVQSNLANTTTGGIAPTGPMWLDTATSSVYHYGVKLLAPTSTNNGAIMAWTIQVEYFISFAGLK